MKTNLYTAITIGPIVETLLAGRKTREIWVASYFFSTFMQEIRNNIPKDAMILLPAEKISEKSFGAGIYPDRLIAKSENFFDVEAIFTKTISTISTKFDIDKEKLINYLNLHYLQISEDDLDKLRISNEIDVSQIHKLNALLNFKELNQKYHYQHHQFISDLFDTKTINKFYKAAFKENKHRFKSILEITAFENKDVKDLIAKETGDESIFKNSSISNLLKDTEKYLAILRADGDNFGKIISSFKTDEEIIKFSEKINLLAESSAEIIENFNGVNIYAGGDDILAFLPVKNGNKTVFHLIENLNDNFRNIFKDEIEKFKVSLSFGLSFTYYKFPLNEALNLSFDLLHKAKKNGKNQLAFQRLQSSNQSRESFLLFSDDGKLSNFTNLLENITKKEEMIQSLNYRLVEDSTILCECLKNENRLSDFLKNHYGDDNDFSKNIKELIISNYNKNIELKIENPELFTLNQVNTIMRMVKFLI